MNRDILRIVIIGVVALVIYYLLPSSAGAIQNAGEMSVQPEGDRLDASAMPKYNPQVDLSVKPGYEPAKAAQLTPVKHNTDVLPYPQISNNYGPQLPTQSGQTQPGLDCYPKDVVTPKELMPKEDGYNAWQQTSPSVNGHLADRNFLESGHHFGIDTISNTMRNANYQLRSDPVIAQVEVGPWQQSTYGADTNRRQFEIGGDY